MSVNYTPPMKGYSGQGSFRFWCQTVLPLVYDDSLSYYELLNKIVVYLNNTISDVANVEDNVTSLLNAYTQLQEYVNNYFDNLNVQEEINSKLDEMAENGELSNLIEPFVGDSVDSWLVEHITPTSPALDDTLTLENAAAQSKAVGDVFKTSMVRRSVGTATSCAELALTGMYFISLVDGSPVPNDAPFAPALLYNFVSASNWKNQVFIPLANNIAPLFRNYNAQTQTWSDLTNFMTPYRNMIYDSDSVNDIANILPDTYRYGYANAIATGLPDNVEPDDLLYIECKSINGGKNVKEIVLFDFTKNIEYVRRYILSNSVWTPQGDWLTQITDFESDDIVSSWNMFEIIDVLATRRKKPTTAYTYRGVTWTWNEANYMYNANGTPTAQSYYNVYVGDMLPWFKKGETYTIKGLRNSTYIQGQLFFQRNGEFITPIYIGTDDIEITIPTDVDNHILLRLATTSSATGVNLVNVEMNLAIGKLGGGGSTTINLNNTINQNEYNISASPTVNQSTPYILSASDDPTTDRTSDIQAMLATYGVCILGKGTFATTGITVGSNQTLKGSGTNSSILQFSGSSSGNCVQLSSNSTVSDLTIFGGASSKPTNDSVNRNGIAYVSNFTPDTGTRLYRPKISNITVYGCGNSGIYCNQTGSATANGLNCINVNIYRCYCGVRIEYYSEYNCFTNIAIDGCYYGIINNSGNTTFANCSIGACDKGFGILSHNGSAPNNGHGSMVGCKINHIGNNTGDTLVLDGCTSFVFSGCQFFYGNFNIKDTTAVLFSGCNFGSISTITLDNSTSIMFDGGFFNNAPTVNKSQDSTTIVSGVYLRNGTAVII